MSIEVRVPTILRSYTGGQKAVAGAGDTIADLLADLDPSSPACAAGSSPTTAACTGSSTSTSTTRTSGSSAPSTPSSTTATR